MRVVKTPLTTVGGTEDIIKQAKAAEEEKRRKNTRKRDGKRNVVAGFE